MEANSEPFRRTLRHIERFYEPEEILKLITEGRPWPYKTAKEFHNTRDQALIAFLYSTACRVNEASKVKLFQFDFKTDPQFVVIREFRISKRKKKTLMAEGVPRIDIPLPVVGRFRPFTDLIIKWYYVREKRATKDDKLFPHTTRRSAYKRVEHITGKWCHWFRSQRLSYLVNATRSELITAKMTGIKNPGTLAHYFRTEWTRHRDEFIG